MSEIEERFTAIDMAKIMLDVEVLDGLLEARIRRTAELAEKVSARYGPGTLRSRQVVANIIADWEATT